MLYFAPWKTALIALTVFLGALFAFPNVVSEEARGGLPGFLRALNLGLDLRGGAHLLYEVDVEQVRADELDTAAKDARRELRGAQIPATGFGVAGDTVVVRLPRASDMDRALEALASISQPIGENPLAFNAARSLRIQAAGDTEIRITVTPEAIEEIRNRTVRQSIEVIRRRIDSTGTSEPVIVRQGAERVLVQAPGVEDPERLKGIIGQTAKMTFHLVASDNPADIQRAVEGRTPPLQLLAETENPLEPYLLLRGNAVLGGEDLNRASQGFHPETGEAIVNFTFNTGAATTFCRLTQENRGQRFAIVLDDTVITAPNINTAICGGSGFIEGNFTVDSASDLSALLEAGALPAELTVIEERTVGPTLGQESIEAGRMALIIGLIGVVVFMSAAYGLFGVFANIALLVNIILIVGALSMFGATLTLPGIAGIILTIGMAVDANVLIFERIREEIRGGRSAANAIEAGYLHARSAIVDANITTLLAAGTLFWFGSGPVRGFAVTLAIGIFTSVFTAFVVSRFFIAAWYGRARPRELPV